MARQLVQESSKGCSSAYRLLRAIFNTAIEDGIVKGNPCRIKGAGSDSTEVRPLPRLDEVQSLFNALPPRIRATVMLAAWGTLRRGKFSACSDEM